MALVQDKPLRVAVVGRTGMLLGAARQVLSLGCELPLVITARAAAHDLISEADYRKLADEAGARFIAGTNISNVKNAVVEANCDVAISMNWPHIIPQGVRSQFRYGIFNAHPGDLPRFKGNACPNWAILLGENQIVLTIHQMVEQLDAGPIALKQTLPLSDDVSIEDVYRWLHVAVPNGFSDLVKRIVTNTLQLTPQPLDRSQALRCYPRRPEDGRINWNANGIDITRLVRASGRPFDGAFTMLKGERRLTVWSAYEVQSDEPFLAVPGQVVGSRDGNPIIAARKSFIALSDFSLEGCEDKGAAKIQILSSLRNRLV